MKMENRKIENTVSKKEVYREQFEYLYLDADASNLVGTNGKIIAVIPVTVDPHDTSGYIPPAAIIASRKLGSGKLKDRLLDVRANGGVTLSDGTQYPRPDYLPPLEYKSVIPDEQPHHTVALDAKLLLQLAEAVSGWGNTIIKLDFPKKPDKAIKIMAPGSDAIGVIMPVKM